MNIDLHISSNKKLKVKTSPDTSLWAIKKMKFKKKDCVYIGDTKVDSLITNKAKISFIFVKYGYCKKKLKYINRIIKFLDIKKIIDV